VTDPRLFIAIPLGGEALSHLTDLLLEAPEVSGVKWTRAVQLHLTLLFMGPTPEERIPELTATLRDLSARHPAFELSLAGWGAFPDPSKPKVLFASVGGRTDALECLASDVRRSIGPSSEGKFQAHITLGRVREKKDAGPAIEFLEEIKESLRGNFLADRLVLFESVLGPTGARYIERASFSLPGMDSSRSVD
jgi:2'-5' RNA ligase